jgi:hypothetical protein
MTCRYQPLGAARQCRWPQLEEESFRRRTRLVSAVADLKDGRAGDRLRLDETRNGRQSA